MSLQHLTADKTCLACHSSVAFRTSNIAMSSCMNTPVSSGSCQGEVESATLPTSDFWCAETPETLQPQLLSHSTRPFLPALLATTLHGRSTFHQQVSGCTFRMHFLLRTLCSGVLCCSGLRHVLYLYLCTTMLCGVQYSQIVMHKAEIQGIAVSTCLLVAYVIVFHTLFMTSLAMCVLCPKQEYFGLSVNSLTSPCT